MSTCYKHVPATIADQADARATQLEGWARLNREHAAGWAGRMGYTRLEMALPSSRDAVGHGQRHFLEQAEQLEAKARAWRERARLAREGVIVPDSTDMEWVAVCQPMSDRWSKPE